MAGNAGSIPSQYSTESFPTPWIGKRFMRPIPEGFARPCETSSHSMVFEESNASKYFVISAGTGTAATSVTQRSAGLRLLIFTASKMAPHGVVLESSFSSNSFWPSCANEAVYTPSFPPSRRCQSESCAASRK